MWKIDKKNLLSHAWLDFEPVTIIDEYDCPMIFTCYDAGSQKFIAYFCDRDNERVRFLVVSSNDTIERKLLSGEMDIREALLRPRMWVFDLDKKWNPISCWRVSLSDLPKNLIPRPGVMLRESMRPMTRQAIAQSITSETVIVSRIGEMPSFTMAGV